MADQAPAEGRAEGGAERGAEGAHGGGSLLKILSFNVWNSNPPSWLYPNRSDRWTRYMLRLNRLADAIVASEAHIVALQEVR